MKNLIDYNDFKWESDYDGEELGYEEVHVVGLYTLKAYPEILVYIDTENHVLIDAAVMR